MTEAPRERGYARRTAARALVSGIGISLLVAAAGQAIGLLLFVARGANGSYAPYARLGALYVQLFQHVDVSARLEAAGVGAALSAELGLALSLVTVVAVVLLALAGRRAGDVAAPVSALAAMVCLAAGYAVVPFALAFVARGRVVLPDAFTVVGPVEVGVSALQAFVLPLAIAAASGAVGALSSPVAALPGRDGSAASVADIVLGGVRALALGLVLSIAGVLVLASVRPSFLRAYLSVVGAPDSATGRAVVAGHAVLLLPNQAMWVLAPAMGACDEAVLDGHATPLLCYWREPARLPLSLAADARIAPASPAFRRPPSWYLAFLVVPLVSTVGGGARAARGTSSARDRAAAGACSGIVFAGLVAASIALVRVDLRVAGALLGETGIRVALGPELLRGTALAAAWGVAGGALGGVLSRYVGGGTGTRTE